MKIEIKIFAISFLVFFFSWVISLNIGVNTLIIQSEDTVPSLLLPVAILKDGTMFLDNYYEFMILRYPHPDDKSYQKDLVPFYLRKVTSPGDNQIHYVSAFPLISGIIGVPVYMIPLALGLPITWELLATLGHLTASITVALSGVTLYKLLKAHFLNSKDSLLLTNVYLFGTINFALLSQAMWQHSVVQLFLIYSLHNLLSSLKQTSTTKNILLSGLFMILAVLTRPTAILVFPLFMLFVFIKIGHNWNKLIKYYFSYLCGLIPGVLFFIWYNKTYYFSIFNQGYADQAGSGWLGRFPEGFLGLLFSPSKGLMVYSPIFLFAFIGIYLVYKRKTYKTDAIYILSFLAFIGHFLVLGKWKHWYGGWSYGYRMGSDVLPFLVILIIPYIKSKYFKHYSTAFYVLFGLSILVQLHGVIFFDGIWHAAYDDGFVHTHWLWSVKNSEFAFNIRRVLVKLGILTSACPNCLPL